MDALIYKITACVVDFSSMFCMQVELSLNFRDVGREKNVAMLIPPYKYFSWSGQWRKERDGENENAPKGMGKSESGCFGGGSFWGG